MAAFTYVARDASGNLVEASLQASTRGDALSSLNGSGLTVVALHGQESATRAAPARALPATSRPRRRFALRVSTADVAVFCRQLAISVNAGVALRDSLDSIAEDLEHPLLRIALRDVVHRLHEGSTFSGALAAHPRIFSPMLVALVRTAEESGSLPETLEHLAAYLERSDRLERKIRNTTAYPVFVAVFFCIVCVVMTLWVLPEFQAVFEGFQTKLPLLSRLVFAANTVLLAHAPHIMVGILALVGGAMLYVRTPGGRFHFDTLKLRLPLFGGWLRKYAVARFCRNLGMMLRGGVPVTSAMELNARVSGNKVLEQSLLQARERIMSGDSISHSLAQDEQFPRLLVRMTAVGEESGQLPEVLERLADVYEDQVEGAILVTMALLEPLLIILFGIVILVLIMAIYLPVFTVGAGVK